MKTFSAVVLCLALSCASIAQAGRLERHLLQSPPGIKEAYASGSAYCQAYNGNCSATASVSTQAINDAVVSIASAYSTAIAQAQNGGDAAADSLAFAQAIGKAYAKIISSHVLSVYVSGDGRACGYTFSNAASFATALSTAVSSAFAQVSNGVAQAAANCFSSVVVSASVQAVQIADFSTCVQGFDYDYINETVITTGYVETIATAFSAVYVAIRDNNADALAICAAIATSLSSMTTNYSG